MFNREEFEAQIDELIKWFDSTESTLELINLDSPDPEQKLQTEQQKLLLMDVAASMSEWRVTASQIKELGGVYRWVVKGPVFSRVLQRQLSVIASSLLIYPGDYHDAGMAYMLRADGVFVSLSFSFSFSACVSGVV